VELFLQFWSEAKHPYIPANNKARVRATPTVPHPKLFVFLAKIEKTFSNSFPSQVVIYPKLGKTDSTHAYMRAMIRDTSSCIRRGGRV
jgi:hypothetical protein